jgi:hypothetical protein
MTKKSVLYTLLAVLVVAGIIGLAWAFTSSSQSSARIEPPVPIAVPIASTPAIKLPLQDLSGNWEADSGNGATMTATITNGEIRITLNNEGAKMLYWVGTFDPKAGAGDTVTSAKIDINKAVLSRAGSKEFIIGKDAISFDLSVAGKTTKVVLSRA